MHQNFERITVGIDNDFALNRRQLLQLSLDGDLLVESVEVSVKPGKFFFEVCHLEIKSETISDSVSSSTSSIVS